jgi:hypothetical protein
MIKGLQVLDGQDKEGNEVESTIYDNEDEGDELDDGDDGKCLFNLDGEFDDDEGEFEDDEDFDDDDEEEEDEKPQKGKKQRKE